MQVIFAHSCPPHLPSWVTFRHKFLSIKLQLKFLILNVCGFPRTFLQWKRAIRLNWGGLMAIPDSQGQFTQSTTIHTTRLKGSSFIVRYHSYQRLGSKHLYLFRRCCFWHLKKVEMQIHKQQNQILFSFVITKFHENLLLEFRASSRGVNHRFYHDTILY